MLLRKVWADTRLLARQAISLLILVGLGVFLFVALYQAYQNLTVAYNTIYDTTRFCGRVGSDGQRA